MRDCWKRLITHLKIGVALLVTTLVAGATFLGTWLAVVLLHRWTRHHITRTQDATTTDTVCAGCLHPCRGMRDAALHTGDESVSVQAIQTEIHETLHALLATMPAQERFSPQELRRLEFVRYLVARGHLRDQQGEDVR